MISKSTEDLIESYTEEIKNKFPLRYAICFFIGIILYWGSTNGLYKSALVSVLNLSPNDAIADKKSLLDIPIYIHTVVFFLTYTLFETSQKITTTYITYIAKLPNIRSQIEKEILIKNPTQVADNLNYSIHTIETLTSKFNTTRDKVEKLSSHSQTVFVIGATFIYSSHNGNLLDFSAGLTMMVLSLFGLHKSCKIFIQDLLPKRAEIRRIFLILNNDAQKSASSNMK
jgi:hypothetical protein